jgi:hypothetical protein
VSAYNDLRNREAQRLYVMSYEKLNDQYKDESFKGSKDQLKERLKAIRALFPLHISEAEPRF